MDTQQCRLYIQWCQSERVELLVEGLVGPTERFVVPQELLQRRSRTFRDLLERQAGELSSKVIQLPDTLVQTMEEFFMWTSSPQPQIDERMTFSEVVRLGIFAWRYQIFALSNQVTDMIRSNLASGRWQLQASMVDDIYDAVPTGSPLREVIRAALGRLPRSSVEGEGRVREEWKATFLKHAQLGWDYCEAGGSKWTSLDYLSGACRFHDHQGVSRQEELFVVENRCPYARDECFPRWEEDSIKSGKDKVGWKEWRAVVQEGDGEQETCGADEERKKEELSIEAVVDGAEEPVATEAMEATDAVVDGLPTKTVVNGVATEAVVEGLPTKAVVNGVATEAVVDGLATEAVVDDLATEAVVDDLATEAVVDDLATEAVVDDLATEAVVNGVVTEAVVDDLATEAVVDDLKTEAVVNGVATEAVVDDLATKAAVDGVVTEAVDAAADDLATKAVVNGVVTEAVVDDQATKAAVDGVATEAVEAVVDDLTTKAVVNGVATEAVVDDLATEAVADGAEGPVTMEALVIITERLDKTVVEKATMESKNGKTGGKGKAKKKRGGR